MLNEMLKIAEVHTAPFNANELTRPVLFEISVLFPARTRLLNIVTALLWLFCVSLQALLREFSLSTKETLHILSCLCVN